MQALTLTLRQGFDWLREGFRIFRRNPALLVFLVFSYWVLMAILNGIPWLGPALATVLLPLFSVGLMNACREIDHGRPVKPLILFSAFRGELRTLLVLGAIYLAAMTAILAIASLADDGILLRWMLAGEPPAEEAIESGELLGAAQIALLLLLPLTMAYWYAPMLAAWQGLPAGKALFFSFFAGLRNWRAFLGYGAATAAFGALLPGVVLGLLAGLLPEGANGIARVLTLPYLMLFAPTLFASFYVSYRDVFVEVGNSDAPKIMTDANGD
ncbi:BPSS1780 family membrane protein [Rhodocyclus purpureus]|uniref:BPSS1780 family membrane protein n=1 Tax=Rhodocyclus purpureus TaxID=1067 RepID=UPI001914A831|nr:BPSS1780 family membrane protein [Rhodocyclus purpureus]MBK5915024.1 hypothetical protein [Rhodocyclus purpureus]